MPDGLDTKTRSTQVGAVRSLALAALLLVLMIVAFHTTAGRTLLPAPLESAVPLRVEVEMALVAERPEACHVEIALHSRGQVRRREAEVLGTGTMEIRESVGGRYEVGVHGRPCTAEPLVVEVEEAGTPSVEVSVANSAPRVPPEASGMDNEVDAAEEDADVGR